MAIEPITQEQSDAFKLWLNEHGLTKAAACKRIRIYRNVLSRPDHKINRLHSRDFVYVVSADDFRADLNAVKAKMIELSQQVMDPELIVKSKEYLDTMNAVEEDLLLNHGIEMNWTNGKSATFNLIRHRIFDPDTLSNLEEAIKNHKNYDIENMYLERFRCGALIEEFGIAPEYDWHKYNIIVKGGKVICAYSFEDMVRLKTARFKTGFFDKFGYNLNICSNEQINEVIRLAEEVRAADAANIEQDIMQS